MRPDARSRLNTAYMTCAYLGGSGGSWLGVRIYGRAGWQGVCALVVLCAVIALGRHRLAPHEHGRGRDARQAGGDGRGVPVPVGIGGPPTAAPPVGSAGRTV
ncbi:hypothetical protein OG594_36745 [Streptomyces sp. NBC_01214]|uniref:hypothetical protein n=1 Tax=Streptomyces sp. NBC_01214 TaxID=2903777 RepID=UPI002255B059|nr:hypothetical protein [Streptomyces sp. NBC_01214]MCX4807105.1 hypothetical protein [Streptomyces sp. NBC_01214]